MASQTIDLSNVDKVEFLQGGVAKEVDVLKLNDTVIWTSEKPEVMQDFVFTVERYTTNTYVNDTSYTNDEIIAFDVTAGEGGCTVTYGDVTTTIPASTTQQVIYGKYKGIDDGTPTSGTMTISGDYTGIKQAKLSTSKTGISYMKNVTGVTQWFGSQLTSLNYFFMTATEVIDAPNFDYAINITNLSGLMAHSGSTSIPENLIKQCKKVTNFSSCFANCSKITSIPNGLFKDFVQATSFASCFYRCSGLTELPVDLFKYNTEIINIGGCFGKCTGLTEIPQDLFKYNTKIKITSGLHGGDSSLEDVSGLFAGCSGITEIPANLFANNPAVTSFDSCFQRCIGLTSIPENLFANNTAVTSFFWCFNGCTGITSIPENLFINNTAVTTYEGCFNGCTALTGTTPVNASGLELWQLAGTTGYPATITGTDCFTNCTGLSNYTNIPSDWGGGATA